MSKEIACSSCSPELLEINQPFWFVQLCDLWHRHAKFRCQSDKTADGGLLFTELPFQLSNRHCQQFEISSLGLNSVPIRHILISIGHNAIIFILYTSRCFELFK